VIINGRKRCRLCKRNLLVSEFPRNVGKADGVANECRECKRREDRRNGGLVPLPRSLWIVGWRPDEHKGAEGKAGFRRAVEAAAMKIWHLDHVEASRAAGYLLLLHDIIRLREEEGELWDHDGNRVWTPAMLGVSGDGGGSSAAGGD